jgi:hypothetical protein
MHYGPHRRVELCSEAWATGSDSAVRLTPQSLTMHYGPHRRVVLYYCIYAELAHTRQGTEKVSGFLYDHLAPSAGGLFYQYRFLLHDYCQHKERISMCCLSNLDFFIVHIHIVYSTVCTLLLDYFPFTFSWLIQKAHSNLGKMV